MPVHKTAIEETVGEEVQKTTEEKHSFYHYDAWQMFKHTLGIYSMTSRYTLEPMRDKYKNVGEINVNQMRDKFDKVTLVNVVFVPPTEVIMEEKSREKLIAYQALEHEEFELKFKHSMIESGVQRLFMEDCGLEFHIMYMTAKEFMNMFDMTEDRWKYLNRYRLEK